MTCVISNIKMNYDGVTNHIHSMREAKRESKVMVECMKETEVMNTY